MTAKRINHLKWIKARLVNVYGENENVDFVLALDEIIRQEVHNQGIQIEQLEHGEKTPVISCTELDRQRSEWKELAMDYMNYDYFLTQQYRIEDEEV